jgi:sugar O-acyltransferase (sialic acid O-acetyltransferase NeuD family)
VRDLVIFGAGGHGRETLDIVEAINARTPTWNFLGFVDDGDPDRERLHRRGTDVIGHSTCLADLDADYVIALGDGGLRRSVHAVLSAYGRAAATLVSPHAILGGDNRFGPGVLVAAGAHVTTNVTIGAHTHLNVGVVVHHDCEIGEFVTISPGAFLNGDVRIGDDAWIGPGAIITRGVSIGSGAVIGAGSVVLGDVPDAERIGGVPARPLLRPLSEPTYRRHGDHGLDGGVAGVA